MPYTYDHPHPAVTVDVAVLTVEDGALKILLIRRANPPFEGDWALPGGFVDIDESLKRAAWRELAEETGVHAGYLTQLGAFGRPDRDPRERIITVAYYALLPARQLRIRADSDAADARLFDVAALPVLAGDHGQIIARTLASVREQSADLELPLRLLPEAFTMSEYQVACECVLGRSLDKRNFQKRVNAAGRLARTGDRRQRGAHRPARLYRRREPTDGSAPIQ